MKRIVLFLDNVHMGLGHNGLNQLAAKHGKRMELIGDDDLVLFINRNKDKLKILGKNYVRSSKPQVFGYLKMPRGQRILLDAIKYLPQTFGGSGFNYDAALERVITKRLHPVPFRRTTPPVSLAYRG